MTRIADFLVRVDGIRGGAAHGAVGERVARAREEFRAHVANDLNVPGAQGVVFELIRDMHAAMDAGQVGEPDAVAIREAFDGFDQVLGVIALRRAEDARPPVPAEEIESLIQARRDARRARDFARADQIRTDLEARGIILEDTAAGTRWKRR